MTTSCCTGCSAACVTVGAGVGVAVAVCVDADAGVGVAVAACVAVAVVALGEVSKTFFWAIELQALIVKNTVHVIRRFNISLLFKVTLLVCVLLIIVMFYNSIWFLKI
jgi:hypothetical protein